MKALFNPDMAILTKEQSVPVAPASSAALPKLYFKNLDGIRFLAALMVMIQHFSDYKGSLAPGTANFEKDFVVNLGSHGVTLFFVLSGFLIFSLLFVEKKYTGTIQIKSFYVRRALRIWQLYFGFGFLSIFAIDYVLSALGTPVSTPISENLFYLVTFSVNLQLIFSYLNRGIVELYWSVCIEEQFYLFAPWLVKKGSRFALIGIVLILIGIVSKFVLQYLISSNVIELKNEEINPLYVFTTCWFDAFGLGILAAYVYFNKDIYKKVKPYVENRLLQAIVLLVAILYVTNAIPRPEVITNYFFSTVAALLFAYIILSASTGNFILKLENPFFARMGKYSYGMYVLHATIIQLILIISLRYIDVSNIWFYELAFPLISFSLVIIASGLSYELFEKQFLKLKKNFTVIQNKKI